MLCTEDLGNSSHIVIHNGTNDLEHLTLSQCNEKLNEVITSAATKYPSSKIIISSILVRADDKDLYRPELNKALGTSCFLHPNVHLVNNDNITVDDLHDQNMSSERKLVS